MSVQLQHVHTAIMTMLHMPAHLTDTMGLVTFPAASLSVRALGSTAAFMDGLAFMDALASMDDPALPVGPDLQDADLASLAHAASLAAE